MVFRTVHPVSCRECISYPMDGQKAAFDSVWHEGMLYKLTETNIDATTFLAFKSFEHQYDKLCNIIRANIQNGLAFFRAQDKVVKVYQSCNFYT